MNNKKMNKKGFTIVELVIVIAVIAILAGVMIPTFVGIITTANESGAMQKVSAAYKEAYALAFKDGAITNGEVVTADVFTFKFTVDANGVVTDCDVCTTSTDKYDYDFDGGKWTATTAQSAADAHNTSGDNGKCSVCGK